MINKTSISILWLTIFWCVSVNAQTDYWKLLEDVHYKNRLEATTGFNITYPEFGENVKQLEGKRITLKGFIVPLDELTGENRFVLSSLPFNICFFCGGAGPETVIEVYSQEHVDFTDDVIWVEGIFYANPDKLMYLLKEARLIEK